jgi:uncharacterized protein
VNHAARAPYPPTPDAAAALDALVDVVVNQYAPLPERSLNELVGRIRLGAPQCATLNRAALARAKARLPNAKVEGTTWYWPEGEKPHSARHRGVDEASASLRLLAPFDPVVWDRRRFELFWGWAYRFEAYTPAPQRVRGYYALPLLWRGQVIGWGNVSWREGALSADCGYVSGKPPHERAYALALEEELARFARFMQARPAAGSPK